MYGRLLVLNKLYFAMSLGKRIRDIALGIGALAVSGAAVYESKKGGDTDGAEARVESHSNDKPTDEKTDMWETETGRLMRQKNNREVFARTKRADAMMEKSNRNLQNVLTAKLSKNPDAKSAQEKMRVQTLKDAMENFDLIVLQERTDSFLRLTVENATVEELKGCLENAQFKSALQTFLKMEREEFGDLKENPPTNESGEVIHDVGTVASYHEEMHTLQQEVNKLQQVLQVKK